MPVDIRERLCQVKLVPFGSTLPDVLSRLSLVRQPITTYSAVRIARYAKEKISR